MKRYISISQSARDALKRKYNVIGRTIWDACRYYTNNKRSVNIRTEALKFGGTYSEEGYAPNCQLEFGKDHIRFKFATGISVIVHQDGKVVYDMWGFSKNQSKVSLYPAMRSLLQMALDSSRDRMAQKDIFSILPEESKR
ncbi:MAG: hypothetical protein ACI3Y2_04635 [Candidatus Egerieousia sp.]